MLFTRRPATGRRVFWYIRPVSPAPRRVMLEEAARPVEMVTMRKHSNDMPGDIADENANALPGGFGLYNPDQSPDALADEVTGLDVVGPTGHAFTSRNLPPGDIAGTNLTDARGTGATANLADLLEGNENHPGAAVGFTGEEREKR